MIATKALPAPRIATSAPGELEIIALGTDPEWNPARALLASGRKTAGALRVELERLRELYLGEGHGGDRRAKNQVSHGDTLDHEQGFQAAIERELGISVSTAYRLMERSEYQERIERVAAAEVGAVLTYEEKGETKKIEVTKTRKTLAQRAVASWALPMAPKPSRLWAGIMGEGGRVDDPDLGNGSTKRQAVEPGKQIRDAMHSLAKWMPNWDELPLNQRAILAQTAKKLGLEQVMAPLWNAVAEVEDES